MPASSGMLLKSGKPSGGSIGAHPLDRDLIPRRVGGVALGIVMVGACGSKAVGSGCPAATTSAIPAIHGGSALE